MSIATRAIATLEVTLSIGEVSEHIQVTEDAPLLEAGSASTGQVIDSQKITDLPMLGRNSFFTVKLSQNVVFVPNPKMGRMQDQNANSQVSIAGGPGQDELNFLVDGISITDSNNRAVFVPSPEAVQDGEASGEHLRRGGFAHGWRHAEFAPALGRQQCFYMEARSGTCGKPTGWRITSLRIAPASLCPSSRFATGPLLWEGRW